jgi:uncharacterized protein YndB with AHSA1/START domain
MSKPDFVYVSYVRTTPARLWDALTSSDFSKRYWFGTELKSDFQVGSPFALVTNGTTTDVGEILKADRPRRLAYTFKHVLRENVRAEPVTKIVFGLEPHGRRQQAARRRLRGMACDPVQSQEHAGIRQTAGDSASGAGNRRHRVDMTSIERHEPI